MAKTPKELSVSQLAHLKVIERWSSTVKVEGYDFVGAIVVTRTDDTHPFSPSPYSDRHCARCKNMQEHPVHLGGRKTYAILPDGKTRSPYPPVTQFVLDDLYEFPYWEFDLLAKLTGLDRKEEYQ